MAFEAVAKCVLIGLNVLVTLFGLLFAAVGGGILFFRTYIDDQLKSVTDYIPEAPSTFSLVSDTPVPSAEDLYTDFSPYLDTFGLVFFLVGLILVIVGLFGCCGACCSSTILLIVYFVVLLVVLIIEGVFVILFYNGTLEERVRIEVQKVSDKQYKGLTGYDAVSLTFNVLMLKFECCGLNSYETFNTAEVWERKRTVEQYGFQIEYTLKVPMCCCKMVGDFPDVNPVDKYCAYEPTDETTYMYKGCMTKFHDMIADQYLYTYIVSALMLIVQVVLLVFTFILCRKSQKVAG